MNDLERLKQAMWAEPMGVVAIPYAECCGKCLMLDDESSCYLGGYIESLIGKPNWCPLHRAIGIITPDGHVVYLREEEK